MQRARQPCVTHSLCSLCPSKNTHSNTHPETNTVSQQQATDAGDARHWAGEAARLQAEVSSLTSDLNAARQELAALQQQHSTSARRVGELEGEVASLSQQLTVRVMECLLVSVGSEAGYPVEHSRRFGSPQFAPPPLLSHSIPPPPPSHIRRPRTAPRC